MHFHFRQLSEKYCLTGGAMSTIFKSFLVASLLLPGIIAHPSPDTAAAPDDLSLELEKFSAVLMPNELLTRHSNNTNEPFFDAVCEGWYESYNGNS
jgi:hypothetical protein